MHDCHMNVLNVTKQNKIHDYWHGYIIISLHLDNHYMRKLMSVYALKILNEKSVLFHCTTKAKKQHNRCNVKHRSCRQLSNTSFSDWFSGGNNFYSLSSRWEKSRVNDAQNVCLHALLPLHDRSIILIRNVSFPEGWGIQQQHGGYLDESEETARRGMIPSTLAPLTTHSTGQKHTSLQCTHPCRAT